MPEQNTCSYCGGIFKPPTLRDFDLGRKRLAKGPHRRECTGLNAPIRSLSVTEQSDLHMSQDDLLQRRIEESRLEEIR
jgi:hypothetical protein